MLETLWYFLFIIAIMLMVIIAYMEYEGDFPIYWLLMFTLLDTIIWFVLASAVFELESSWEMYNATSGNIETGIHIVSSKTCPEVSMFCNMMAGVMIAYGAYAFISLFRELYREHTGNDMIYEEE